MDYSKHLVFLLCILGVYCNTTPAPVHSTTHSVSSTENNTSTENEDPSEGPAVYLEGALDIYTVNFNNLYRAHNDSATNSSSAHNVAHNSSSLSTVLSLLRRDLSHHSGENDTRSEEEALAHHSEHNVPIMMMPFSEHRGQRSTTVNGDEHDKGADHHILHLKETSHVSTVLSPKESSTEKPASFSKRHIDDNNVQISSDKDTHSPDPNFPKYLQKRSAVYPLEFFQNFFSQNLEETTKSSSELTTPEIKLTGTEKPTVAAATTPAAVVSTVEHNHKSTEHELKLTGTEKNPTTAVTSAPVEIVTSAPTTLHTVGSISTTEASIQTSPKIHNIVSIH